jgi:hypothetical protein
MAGKVFEKYLLPNLFTLFDFPMGGFTRFPIKILYEFLFLPCQVVFITLATLVKTMIFTGTVARA